MVVVVLDAAVDAVVEGGVVGDAESPELQAVAPSASTATTSAIVATDGNDRPCWVGMDAVWLVLMFAAGIALLWYARRIAPMRSARDGSWFDCKVQILQGGPQATDWIAAQGEVVGDAVVLSLPMRRGDFSGPLAIVHKSPDPPPRLSVFIGRDWMHEMVIAVERNSAADERLTQLIG